MDMTAETGYFEREHVRYMLEALRYNWPNNFGGYGFSAAVSTP